MRLIFEMIQKQIENRNLTRVTIPFSDSTTDTTGKDKSDELASYQCFLGNNAWLMMITLSNKIKLCVFAVD